MAPVEISAVNRSLQMSPSYLPLAAPAWGTNLEELTGHLPNQPWQPALRSLDDRTQQYNRIQHQKTHTHTSCNISESCVHILYELYAPMGQLRNCWSGKWTQRRKHEVLLQSRTAFSSFIGIQIFKPQEKMNKWLGSDDEQSGDGASNGTHAATSFYSPKVWLRLHFICPWGSFMRSRPSTLFRCRWLVWNAFKRTSKTASAP